jgi:hypothetical protein
VADEDDFQRAMDNDYRLVYDVALRWLDDQSRRLDTLRDRIGTLFAAAGVVGGFLTALVFGPDRPQKITLPGQIALGVAAVALLVILIALLVVWLPRRAIETNLNPRIVLDEYIGDEEQPLSGWLLRGGLARVMTEAAEANQNVLECLQNWFAGAAIAFLVGVLALGVALWDVLT